MSVAARASSRRPAGFLAATAVGVIGLTLLARGVGLLSQVVTSAAVGASASADAYYFSVTIVTMVSSLIFGTVPLVFIPHYLHVESQEGQEAADRLASGVITYLALVLAALALAAALLAWPLVGWVGRFSPDSRVLVAGIFLAIAPLIFLMGITQLLIMLFHARTRFTWPAVVGVVNGIVFVLVVVLGWTRFNIYALVLGTLGGAVVQAVILYAAIRGAMTLRPSLILRRQDVTELLGLAWPLVVGQATTLVWVAYTRSIASGLPAGSLAALSYADGIKGIFLSTVVVPIAAMALPIFSDKIARTDGRAWEDLQRSLSALWYVTAPVVVGFVLLGEPLVRLLYQRGAFDPRATHLTASALVFFGLGLFGEAGNYLVTRYYMALKDTRTLAWIAFPLTALHCGLAWCLSRILLADGVALAYSLFMIASLSTAFLILKGRSGRPLAPTFIRGTMKVLMSGCFTLLVGLALQKVLPALFRGSVLDALAIAVVLGATYLFCASLSGVSRDVPLIASLHPVHLLRGRAARVSLDPHAL